MNYWRPFVGCTLLLTGSHLCAQNPVVTNLGALPGSLKECSGLVNDGNGRFWMHNDSGNSAKFYLVDTTCAIIRTINVMNAQNIDWEDIAIDPEGNVYLADFGNNDNNRTDLRILKVAAGQLAGTNNVITTSINISYADQLAFPPADGQKLFDAEALIFDNDSLHIFTKDRTSPYLGITRHYVCPAMEGDHVLQPRSMFTLGPLGSFMFSVTGADISPDGSQLALINADRVWLFSNFSGSDYFNGDVRVLNLGFISQKEGVTFQNGFLYFTDEQYSGIGGNLYRIHPDVMASIDLDQKAQSVHAVYNTTGEFLYVNVPKQTGFTHWKILTTHGKLVREGTIDPLGSGQIELPGIPVGLYVFQALDGRNKGVAQLMEWR